MSEDMAAILRTIREVGESLERRAQRAAGANLMIWGLVSASIFLFYQLVEWRPEPYREAFGSALSWVWLAPVAAGYVASAVVGARFGRAGDDAAAWADYRRGLVPGTIVTLLAIVLIATGQHAFIPGALVATVGIFFVSIRERESRVDRACRRTGLAMIGAGIALVFLAGAAWASLAAAVAMGLPLFGVGAWLYATAR